MAERRDPAPTDFGVRDLAWAALAGVICLLLLVSVASTLVDLAAGEPRLAPVLSMPFGVLSGVWLALAAWRRSVWGSRRGRDGGAEAPSAGAG